MLETYDQEHELGQEAFDLLEPNAMQEFNLVTPVEPIIHTEKYAIGIVTHTHFPGEQFVLAVLPGKIKGEHPILSAGMRLIDQTENISQNSLLQVYTNLKNQDISSYEHMFLMHYFLNFSHEEKMEYIISEAIKTPDTTQFVVYLDNSGANSSLEEIDSVG